MDNSQFRKYHLDTMSRIAAALNETMDADADAVQNAASNIKSFIQRKFGNEKWVCFFNFVTQLNCFVIII